MPIVIWIDGYCTWVLNEHGKSFGSIEEAQEFCDKYVSPRTSADAFPMEVDDTTFIEGPN